MTTRILVVEDDAKNRKLVRDILVYRGHEVVEAPQFDVARAALREQSFDLVVLDVGTTGGGQDLLKDIRRDPRSSAVPVVAVTGLVMPGDKDRLLSAGFDGYIGKPIDTRTFGASIESFLKR